MKDQLNEWLTKAFETGVSDVHFTVGQPPIFRINGELEKQGERLLKPEETEAMAKAVLSEPLWNQFLKQGDIDFSYGIRGVSRFRMNAYFQRGCVSLAVRVIPTEVPTLEDLKLPNVLKKVAEKPSGLVLVTGPTGSGKSTTMAAMVDHINKTMKRHVITLEDPIEYLHRHHHSIIDQREIGFDAKNFSSGLRASLRQDPDVILVGEMRDLETISTALTAAETGHLVLGTLHTTSAAKTINRIIDIFPSDQQGQTRIQLASVLSAVIAQQLFPLKGGEGRTAATEILLNYPAVANLIRNEKVHQIENVMQTSRSEGMHTMKMDIQRLISENKVSESKATSMLSE
ncbi:type IV pilus twitching motility protein PilT [Texcoconibacillus texcoconensis]|uniref:Twitching motility protein PilT n=1 Tax=Texcoconibacillus texcoconensis TaxID=1095777 RepID=A0A840QSW4_9BACI|nr:type IV pilus twitching motility protein PilT [Texcoconibacillus texcoconensis]MBB5174398.1 twitching motility protein PilT [Texcoconibacillus texcoconensis]